jgi:hypothetical protein
MNFECFLYPNYFNRKLYVRTEMICLRREIHMKHKSDMSTPRDIHRTQSKMSTPRDTHEALSDITNVIGMLTIFSYAALYAMPYWWSKWSKGIVQTPTLGEACAEEGWKEYVAIMDPLKDGICFKGYDQRMAYMSTFQWTPFKDGVRFKGYDKKWHICLHSTLLLECSISPWGYLILSGTTIFMNGIKNTLHV